MLLLPYEKNFTAVYGIYSRAGNKTDGALENVFLNKCLVLRFIQHKIFGTQISSPEIFLNIDNSS